MLAGCHQRSAARALNGGAAGPPTTPATTPLAGDAAAAALVASVEVWAINAIQAGMSLMAANKLGQMPAALITFATTVAGHHQAALRRWNEVLATKGLAGVSQPPADLQAEVDRMFTRVTTASALARVELLVEQTAADTYLSVLPRLSSPDLVTVAAQLQALDQEHAATLHFLLGTYPVPDAMQNTNLSVRAGNA